MELLVIRYDRYVNLFPAVTFIKSVASFLQVAARFCSVEMQSLPSKSCDNQPIFVQVFLCSFVFACFASRGETVVIKVYSLYMTCKFCVLE